VLKVCMDSLLFENRALCINAHMCVDSKYLSIV
jgi:hypothetical protein